MSELMSGVIATDVHDNAKNVNVNVNVNVNLNVYVKFYVPYEFQR